MRLSTVFISILSWLSCCHQNKCEISKYMHIYYSKQAAQNLIRQNSAHLLCIIMGPAQMDAVSLLKGREMQIELNWTSSQTETRITSLRKSPGQRSGCFPTERYQGSPLRKRTEHLPSETRGSPHQKWPGCFCSDADQVNLSHKKTKLFPLRQRPALLHSEQDQNDSPQTETMVSTQKKNRA